MDTVLALKDVTKKIRDKTILDQADKVELIPDKEVDDLAIKRGLRAARIKITTHDRNEFQVIKEIALGAPDNPLSEAQLESKFLALARDAIGNSKANQLNEHLMQLENLEDIQVILDVSSCES